MSGFAKQNEMCAASCITHYDMKVIMRDTFI